VAGATAAVGAAVAAGIAASMNNFISVGGAIDDLVARTGASTKQMQEWKFAAEQSGASAEDLEAALRRMAKNGMSPAAFEALAAKIAAIEDPGQRAAAALESFGKAGTRLLPMFRDLTDLKARSEAIGPILSPEEVALADKLGDSFGVLRESLSRLANQIAIAFGPTLQGALEKAIGAVVFMGQTLKDVREANPFGSGGDWLDKIVAAEKSLANGEWAGRGAAAVAGGGKFGKGGFNSEDTTAAVETKGAEFDVTKSILEAERKRLALMQEFLTPQERFLNKQNEIFAALKQVNQNKVLNFISPEQAALEKRGLEIALQRARAAEMERRSRLAGKPAIEKKTGVPIEMKGPEFSVTSATSAAGALALTGGGGGIAGKSYAELQQIRKFMAITAAAAKESAARRDRPGIFR